MNTKIAAKADKISIQVQNSNSSKKTVTHFLHNIFFLSVEILVKAFPENAFSFFSVLISIN